MARLCVLQKCCVVVLYASSLARAGSTSALQDLDPLNPADMASTSNSTLTLQGLLQNAKLVQQLFGMHELMTCQLHTTMAHAAGQARKRRWAGLLHSLQSSGWGGGGGGGGGGGRGFCALPWVTPRTPQPLQQQEMSTRLTQPLRAPHG